MSIQDAVPIVRGNPTLPGIQHTAVADLAIRGIVRMATDDPVGFNSGEQVGDLVV